MGAPAILGNDTIFMLGINLNKQSDNQSPAVGGIGGVKMKKSKPAGKPGWANGLRQIYDSVVDEPLPDSFTDLLAKLDRGN
ncbi:NepR family anti-sigma factor [Tsuneonella aeria]